MPESFHGLHPGRHAVVHELVHAARFLGAMYWLDVEAAHRAAEAHRKGGDVEARHRADAAFSGEDASQAAWTVLPTGEMMPSPVTTTRRLLTRYPVAPPVLRPWCDVR